MSNAKRLIVYLGFNDPRRHVRGTENVIRAQAAATEGHHYYVFRSPKIEVFRWKGLVAIGCPVNLLIAGLFLRRLVARIRSKGVIPLLHGHNYLLSAVASGAPQVFTVHDGLTYLKRHFDVKRLWPYELVERLVYWRAVKIHAISRFTWSEACANAAATAKLSIIPNSIPAAVDVSGAMDISDIPRGSPEYLIVRSIEERANFELVLRLARHCLTYEPDARILVAGRGPLLTHYQEVVVVQNLTNLHFLGYVTDAKLDALYQRTNCVLMPALYGEGFGLPLIEAYARGVPAVGSDVCAVPEVVADPALVFGDDLPSLLAAIKFACAMPRDRFVDHFRRHYDRDLILDRYRAFYQSVY
jgi:glycosyltransferase involved in cell wall biosynthesis